MMVQVPDGVSVCVWLPSFAYSRKRSSGRSEGGSTGAGHWRWLWL